MYPFLEAFLLWELRAQNLPRPRECAHQEKIPDDMYSVLGIIMRGVISTSSTWFSDLYILALRKMAPSSGHRFKAYMASCRTTPQSLRVESLNESLSEPLLASPLLYQTSCLPMMRYKIGSLNSMVISLLLHNFCIDMRPLARGNFV